MIHKVYIFCSQFDISRNNLSETIKGKKIKFAAFTKPNNTIQSNIIDKLNLAMDNPTDTNQFKFYDLQEFNASNDITQNKFSLFHQNISSLQFHFEELQALLSELKLKFDIIGITESRIRKNIHPVSDISLKDYNIEHTPTESSCGGALLYIKNNLNYQLRSDLIIYKAKELESIFVEIFNKNSKKKNTIIGCIYKHPKLSTTEFTELYLQKLLNKVSKENKNVILMGDFNINILEYDSETSVSEFLDIMYENLLLPYITGPTRITSKSSTLIDNIFFNGVEDNTISRNLVTSLSDHLAQFMILPHNNSVEIKI